MKSLLILVFLFPFNIYGQNIDKFPCDLLQKSIESIDFQKHLSIKKDSGLDLIFIDLEDHFQNCQLPEVFKRKISINHTTKGLAPGSHDIPKEWQNNFRIGVVGEKTIRKNNDGAIYELHFWQTWSNKGITIELWENKNKKIIKVLAKSKGVF